MQQICCSYFSTSITSMWTVEARCFLSSSNTGKKSNMFDFFVRVSGNSIASCVDASVTVIAKKRATANQRAAFCFGFVYYYYYYYYWYGVIIIVIITIIINVFGLSPFGCNLRSTGGSDKR
jgi:hypothetical protein